MKQDSTTKLTEPTTSFGRFFRVFRELQNQLQSEKRNSINALVIGPGIYTKQSVDEDYIRSFQTFELINSILRAGIKEYRIEIMDNNPAVIQEYNSNKKLLKIPRYDDQRSSHVDYSTYFWNFMKDSVIESEGSNKIVQLDEKILKRIHTKKDDIMTNSLGKNLYDIVICTALLGHYQQDSYSRKVNQTIGKITNSINFGGYFITTEIDYLNVNINYGNWKTILPDYERKSCTNIEEVNGLLKKISK